MKVKCHKLLLHSLLIKLCNLKLIGLLGETSYLLYFSGRDGKEKRKRKEESINGCLKKRNTEKKEKIWNENIKESLKDEELNFKISKRIIFIKCKTIGRQDTMKK